MMRTPAIRPALPLLIAMSILQVLSGEERVALVVGNNRYAHGAALANPVNDARAVGAALEKVGFSVILGTDLGHEAMEKKVVEFSRQAEGAQAALFYYAGHGIELGGSNYLIPVDANVEA